MEVFVKGAPSRVTETQFSDFVRPILADLNIYDWQCEKRKQKAFAYIRFLNARDGLRFLARYGQADNATNSRRLPTDKSNIMFFGQPLLCFHSNKDVDPLALKSLQMESKARLQSQDLASQIGTEPRFKTGNGSLRIVALSCGMWTYRDSRPIFVSYFTCRSQGIMTFGIKTATVALESGERIDFWYSTVREINLEGLPQAAITMTMVQTPHFLRPTNREGESHYEDQIQPRWTRMPCLNSQHASISGTCLVYRVHLENYSVNQQNQAMGKAHGLLSPVMIQHRVTMTLPTESYKVEMDTFLRELDSISPAQTPAVLPFSVKFQLQRLVQNAKIPVRTVRKLLPEVNKILSRSGPRISAYAIRRLWDQLRYPCLQTDAVELDHGAIVTKLVQNEEQLRNGHIYKYEEPDLKTRAYIHRVVFTPTGMHLYGPDPENNNRVLRRYRRYHEYFARVVFCDEDGEPIRFSSQWSNDVLYHQRFKTILNEGFSVAGRRYDFLGFSHSSLRTQSCWFMAPFIHEGSLLFDRKLIEGLGDFSKIRCPAKCAARIGQAFSVTPVAVTVKKKVAQVIPDVERNGRVFSDGVGTISQALLEKLCAALPPERSGKSRAFQIRYSGKCQPYSCTRPLASMPITYLIRIADHGLTPQILGAKGMVALDSRLSGERMFLRDSMIKFPGLGSLDIEICEAAHRPLPYFLNQQTIKILEDMGVSEDFFFYHQKKEVNRLRLTTSNSARASKFLKSHAIGDGIHLSWFIKKLSDMNLSFRQDTFLRNVVDMAVLIDLRALKYKARIPVKEGYTLHGLMDETGLLEEGQIFCIVEEEGSAKVIARKNLVISRSPALHPGDVRTVTGVRVPANSPLMQLRNCICFSSKGQRDLPSQLSGGDLDGDLYQVLYDPQALPQHVFIPADYPRPEPIDLGRAVQRHDMTDFFVTFVSLLPSSSFRNLLVPQETQEHCSSKLPLSDSISRTMLTRREQKMATDQLGRIANQHKILADQKPSGTLDPACIRLAELHSTAVGMSSCYGKSSL